MNKWVIILALPCVFLACDFEKRDDSTIIPNNLKVQAEKKFGRNFDNTREELGLQKIPNDWRVISNDSYEIYFAKYDNIEKVNGYVCKVVTYDQNLNILSEEDYYRPKIQNSKKTLNECDDNHLAFIYDFQDYTYHFDSRCCVECGNIFESEWEGTKEGYLKKLNAALTKMGIK